MGVFHSFKSVLAQLQQWGKVKEVCITQMLDPTDVDVQVKSKGSSRGEFERLFVDYYTFRSKASLWCSSSRGGARRDGAVSVRMPCVL
jgi:hypothetical protein